MTQEQLHPRFIELEVGDWFQFSTPHFNRIGRVLEKKGRSLRVQYQAREGTVAIPDAEIYFHDSDDLKRGTVFKRIPAQNRIPFPTGEWATLEQAAHLLDSTPKALRQKLRDGELEGKRNGGRWTKVKLP